MNFYCDNERYERSKIGRLRFEREEIQEKTYKNWINSILIQARTSIQNLYCDLASGDKLILLLRLLTGEHVATINKSSSLLHKIANVSQALRFIKSKNVYLESIGPDDIVNGNKTLTLGLIWTLILRFQLSKHLDLDEYDLKSIKESLLVWCNNRIKRLNDIDNSFFTLQVVDFHKSWQNGWPFIALVYSFKADCIDINQLKCKQNRELLSIAFDTAYQHLLIPKILDIDDVINEPDENSILTYISYFYNLHCKMKHSETNVKRIQYLLTNINDIDHMQQSYYNQSKSLLDWIQTKIILFTTPLSTDNVESCMSEFNQYFYNERCDQLKNRNDCLTIYFKIINTQKEIGIAIFKPESGFKIKDIEKSWLNLEIIETKYLSNLKTILHDRQKLCQQAEMFDVKSKKFENYIVNKLELLNNINNIQSSDDLEHHLKQSETICLDINENNNKFDSLLTIANQLIEQKFGDINFYSQYLQHIHDKMISLQQLATKNLHSIELTRYLFNQLSTVDNLLSESSDLHEQINRIQISTDRIDSIQNILLNLERLKYIEIYLIVLEKDYLELQRKFNSIRFDDQYQQCFSLIDLDIYENKLENLKSIIISCRDLIEKFKKLCEYQINLNEFQTNIDCLNQFLHEKQLLSLTDSNEYQPIIKSSTINFIQRRNNIIKLEMKVMQRELYSTCEKGFLIINSNDNESINQSINESIETIKNNFKHFIRIINERTILINDCLQLFQLSNELKQHEQLIKSMDQNFNDNIRYKVDIYQNDLFYLQDIIDKFNQLSIKIKKLDQITHLVYLGKYEPISLIDLKPAHWYLCIEIDLPDLHLDQFHSLNMALFQLIQNRIDHIKQLVSLTDNDFDLEKLKKMLSLQIDEKQQNCDQYETMKLDNIPDKIEEIDLIFDIFFQQNQQQQQTLEQLLKERNHSIISDYSNMKSLSETIKHTMKLIQSTKDIIDLCETNLLVSSSSEDAPCDHTNNQQTQNEIIIDEDDEPVETITLVNTVNQENPNIISNDLIDEPKSIDVNVKKRIFIIHNIKNDILFIKQYLINKNTDNNSHKDLKFRLNLLHKIIYDNIKRIDIFIYENSNEYNDLNMENEMCSLLKECGKEIGHYQKLSLFKELIDDFYLNMDNLFDQLQCIQLNNITDLNESIVRNDLRIVESIDISYNYYKDLFDEFNRHNDIQNDHRIYPYTNDLIAILRKLDSTIETTRKLLDKRWKWLQMKEKQIRIDEFMKRLCKSNQKHNEYLIQIEQLSAQPLDEKVEETVINDELTVEESNPTIDHDSLRFNELIRELEMIKFDIDCNINMHKYKNEQIEIIYDEAIHLTDDPLMIDHLNRIKKEIHMLLQKRKNRLELEDFQLSSEYFLNCCKQDIQLLNELLAEFDQSFNDRSTNRQLIETKISNLKFNYRHYKNLLEIIEQNNLHSKQPEICSKIILLNDTLDELCEKLKNFDILTNLQEKYQQISSNIEYIIIILDEYYDIDLNILTELKSKTIEITIQIEQFENDSNYENFKDKFNCNKCRESINIINFIINYKIFKFEIEDKLKQFKERKILDEDSDDEFTLFIIEIQEQQTIIDNKLKKINEFDSNQIQLLNQLMTNLQELLKKLNRFSYLIEIDKHRRSLKSNDSCPQPINVDPASRVIKRIISKKPKKISEIKRYFVKRTPQNEETLTNEDLINNNCETPVEHFEDFSEQLIESTTNIILEDSHNYSSDEDSTKIYEVFIQLEDEPTDQSKSKAKDLRIKKHSDSFDQPIDEIEIVDIIIEDSDMSTNKNKIIKKIQNKADDTGDDNTTNIIEESDQSKIFDSSDTEVITGNMKLIKSDDQISYVSDSPKIKPKLKKINKKIKKKNTLPVTVDDVIFDADKTVNSDVQEIPPKEQDAEKCIIAPIAYNKPDNSSDICIGHERSRSLSQENNEIIDNITDATIDKNSDEKIIIENPDNDKKLSADHSKEVSPINLLANKPHLSKSQKKKLKKKLKAANRMKDSAPDPIDAPVDSDANDQNETIDLNQSNRFEKLEDDPLNEINVKITAVMDTIYDDAQKQPKNQLAHSVDKHQPSNKKHKKTKKKSKLRENMARDKSETELQINANVDDISKDESSNSAYYCQLSSDPAQRSVEITGENTEDHPADTNTDFPITEQQALDESHDFNPTTSDDWLEYLSPIEQDDNHILCINDVKSTMNEPIINDEIPQYSGQTQSKSNDKYMKSMPSSDDWLDYLSPSTSNYIKHDFDSSIIDPIENIGNNPIETNSNSPITEQQELDDSHEFNPKTSDDWMQYLSPMEQKDNHIPCISDVKSENDQSSNDKSTMNEPIINDKILQYSGQTQSKSNDKYMKSMPSSDDWLDYLSSPISNNIKHDFDSSIIDPIENIENHPIEINSNSPITEQQASDEFHEFNPKTSDDWMEYLSPMEQNDGHIPCINDVKSENEQSSADKSIMKKHVINDEIKNNDEILQDSDRTQSKSSDKIIVSVPSSDDWLDYLSPSTSNNIKQNFDSSIIDSIDKNIDPDISTNFENPSSKDMNKQNIDRNEPEIKPYSKNENNSDLKENENNSVKFDSNPAEHHPLETNSPPAVQQALDESYEFNPKTSDDWLEYLSPIEQNDYYVHKENYVRSENEQSSTDKSKRDEINDSDDIIAHDTSINENIDNKSESNGSHPINQNESSEIIEPIPSTGTIIVPEVKNNSKQPCEDSDICLNQSANGQQQQPSKKGKKSRKKSKSKTKIDPAILNSQFNHQKSAEPNFDSAHNYGDSTQKANEIMDFDYSNDLLNCLSDKPVQKLDTSNTEMLIIELKQPIDDVDIISSETNHDTLRSEGHKQSSNKVSHNELSEPNEKNVSIIKSDLSADNSGQIFDNTYESKFKCDIPDDWLDYLSDPATNSPDLDGNAQIRHGGYINENDENSIQIPESSKNPSNINTIDSNNENIESFEKNSNNISKQNVHINSKVDPDEKQPSFTDSDSSTKDQAIKEAITITTKYGEGVVDDQQIPVEKLNENEHNLPHENIIHQNQNLIDSKSNDIQANDKHFSFDNQTKFVDENNFDDIKSENKKLENTHTQQKDKTRMAEPKLTFETDANNNQSIDLLDSELPLVSNLSNDRILPKTSSINCVDGFGSGNNVQSILNTPYDSYNFPNNISDDWLDYLSTQNGLKSNNHLINDEIRNLNDSNHQKEEFEIFKNYQNDEILEQPKIQRDGQELSNDKNKFTDKQTKGKDNVDFVSNKLSSKLNRADIIENFNQLFPLSYNQIKNKHTNNLKSEVDEISNHHENENINNDKTNEFFVINATMSPHDDFDHLPINNSEVDCNSEDGNVDDSLLDDLELRIDNLIQRINYLIIEIVVFINGSSNQNDYEQFSTIEQLEDLIKTKLNDSQKLDTNEITSKLNIADFHDQCKDQENQLKSVVHVESNSIPNDFNDCLKIDKMHKKHPTSLNKRNENDCCRQTPQLDPASDVISESPFIDQRKLAATNSKNNLKNKRRKIDHNFNENDSDGIYCKNDDKISQNSDQTQGKSNDGYIVSVSSSDDWLDYLSPSTSNNIKQDFDSSIIDPIDKDIDSNISTNFENSHLRDMKKSNIYTDEPGIKPFSANENNFDLKENENDSINTAPNSIAHHPLVTDSNTEQQALEESHEFNPKTSDYWLEYVSPIQKNINQIHCTNDVKLENDRLRNDRSIVNKHVISDEIKDNDEIFQDSGHGYRSKSNDGYMESVPSSDDWLDYLSPPTSDTIKLDYDSSIIVPIEKDIHYNEKQTKPFAENESNFDPKQNKSDKIKIYSNPNEYYSMENNSNFPITVHQALDESHEFKPKTSDDWLEYLLPIEQNVNNISCVNDVRPVNEQSSIEKSMIKRHEIKDPDFIAHDTYMFENIDSKSQSNDSHPIDRNESSEIIEPMPSTKTVIEDNSKEPNENSDICLNRTANDHHPSKKVKKSRKKSKSEKRKIEPADFESQLNYQKTVQPDEKNESGIKPTKSVTNTDNVPDNTHVSQFKWGISDDWLNYLSVPTTNSSDSNEIDAEAQIEHGEWSRGNNNSDDWLEYLSPIQQNDSHISCVSDVESENEQSSTGESIINKDEINDLIKNNDEISHNSDQTQGKSNDGYIVSVPSSDDWLDYLSPSTSNNIKQDFDSSIIDPIEKEIDSYISTNFENSYLRDMNKLNVARDEPDIKPFSENENNFDPKQNENDSINTAPNSIVHHPLETDSNTEQQALEESHEFKPNTSDDWLEYLSPKRLKFNDSDNIIAQDTNTIENIGDKSDSNVAHLFSRNKSIKPMPSTETIIVGEITDNSKQPCEDSDIYLNPSTAYHQQHPSKKGKKSKNKSKSAKTKIGPADVKLQFNHQKTVDPVEKDTSIIKSVLLATNTDQISNNTHESQFKYDISDDWLDYLSVSRSNSSDSDEIDAKAQIKHGGSSNESYENSKQIPELSKNLSNRNSIESFNENIQPTEKNSTTNPSGFVSADNFDDSPQKANEIITLDYSDDWLNYLSDKPVEKSDTSNIEMSIIRMKQPIDGADIIYPKTNHDTIRPDHKQPNDKVSHNKISKKQKFNHKGDSLKLKDKIDVKTTSSPITTVSDTQISINENPQSDYIPNTIECKEAGNLNQKHQNDVDEKTIHSAIDHNIDQLYNQSINNDLSKGTPLLTNKNQSSNNSKSISKDQTNKPVTKNDSPIVINNPLISKTKTKKKIAKSNSKIIHSDKNHPLIIQTKMQNDKQTMIDNSQNDQQIISNLSFNDINNNNSDNNNSNRDDNGPSTSMHHSEQTSKNSTKHRLKRIFQYSLIIYLLLFLLISIFLIWPKDEDDLNCLRRNSNDYYTITVKKMYLHGSPPI